MYSGNRARPSNGRTNINKPFKSPVITSQPKKQQPKIFQGLLDDIEDSDEGEQSDRDRPNEVINLISPEKVLKSPKLSPEVEPTDQKSQKEDDDEIEEPKDGEEEEKIPRRILSSGKKGKFATRQQREASQYLERRKTEREAAAVEAKKSALKFPASAAALLKHIENLDPVKLEESPKPTPQKSIKEIREKYDSLLKRNGVTLDPKLISLLDDKLDQEGSNSGSDSDSDSDNSVSSVSSRKRKRRSSDSDSSPKKTEASKLEKQKKKAKSQPRKYRCPMCNEEVAKQLYESYLPDLEKRYKIDLRRKFHKSHKLAKVHKKVSELDIPEIDWEILEDRCKKYFPYLSDIMTRKTKSHFRDLSEKFNKAKRNDKTRTKAILDDGNWEKTYPGYYGPRGSEIMGDAISNSKLIMAALKKLRAEKDITTTGGGAGSYIQGILIPELGTRLIMEDFEMSEDEIDKARKLMENTIDIGLVINHGDDDGDDVTGVGDGMEWWWKEQDAKRRQEEETEQSQSQASIYIEASDEE
ncbi:hypothetical protein TWF718_001500 [Orbilia javanica]|uniref:Restriction of telomere capping protein 4 n=1 Tax=Orbilia javanica TaxID=47235 RepID=A0AAN8P2M8_9PEZI